MGSDTRGKREIDPVLVQAATTFVGDWTQATNLGECQHLAGADINETGIAGTMGMLAAGLHRRRRTATDITILTAPG